MAGKGPHVGTESRHRLGLLEGDTEVQRSTLVGLDRKDRLREPERLARPLAGPRAADGLIQPKAGPSGESTGTRPWPSPGWPTAPSWARPWSTGCSTTRAPNGWRSWRGSSARASTPSLEPGGLRPCSDLVRCNGAACYQPGRPGGAAPCPEEGSRLADRLRQPEAARRRRGCGQGTELQVFGPSWAGLRLSPGELAGSRWAGGAPRHAGGTALGAPARLRACCSAPEPASLAICRCQRPGGSSFARCSPPGSITKCRPLRSTAGLFGDRGGGAVGISGLATAGGAWSAACCRTRPLAGSLTDDRRERQENPDRAAAVLFAGVIARAPGCEPLQA